MALAGENNESLDLFRFVLIAVAGWMNQQQQDAIDYLREENRILREQLGGRRLRLNDDQQGETRKPENAGSSRYDRHAQSA